MLSASDWMAINERARELRADRAAEQARLIRVAFAERVDSDELDWAWRIDEQRAKAEAGRNPRNITRRRTVTCRNCNHTWTSSAQRPTCSQCRHRDHELGEWETL